jgi:hypothetical protein
MIACVFRCFFMLRIARGNMECDMGAGGKRIVLDLIEDPEEGIALLSKERTGWWGGLDAFEIWGGWPIEPPSETPESRTLRKFWQFQFTQWRYWLAGDSLAIPRAIYCCRVMHQPPPRWLVDASVQFAERGMLPKERDAQTDFARHHRRWELVEASIRRHDKLQVESPRRAGNFNEDPVERAAEILNQTEPAVSDDTIRDSHRLINDAGGAHATFESYRREAHQRNRHNRRLAQHRPR